MLPTTLVRDQVLAVKHDLEPATVKTGALGSEEMICTVRELLDEHPCDWLVVEAIDFARQFIIGAIEHAPKIGHGISPVHPLHVLWGPPS